MRRFTKEHEWIERTGDTARCGITAYAQEQLGDVVFAEVPAAGTALTQGKEAAVVESVKAASDIYAPVSGTVVEGNAALDDDPSLVNTDPEGDGWFWTMTLSNEDDLDALMDEDAYKAFVADL